jgi:hypothetical protein
MFESEENQQTPGDSHRFCPLYPKDLQTRTGRASFHPLSCAKIFTYIPFIYLYIFLVGGLEHFFIFPDIGKNHPN